MSIKELRKLKKLLLEANTPTKEEEVAKALRVIFQSISFILENRIYKFSNSSKIKLFRPY